MSRENTTTIEEFARNPSEDEPQTKQQTSERVTHDETTTDMNSSSKGSPESHRATLAHYFVHVSINPPKHLWNQSIETLEHGLHLPKQIKHRAYQIFHEACALSPRTALEMKVRRKHKLR